MAYQSTLKVLAIAFALALTVTAIYAWIQSSQLSLPVPTFALVLSTMIPALSFIGLARFQTSGTKGTAELLWLFSLLDAILMTLASSHLAGSTLSCALETQWRSMFQHKSKQIKRIQDSLDCCGFRSTRDKAWPFPSKDNKVEACVDAFHRRDSCFGPWQHQERIILGLMIAIGACTLLSKLFVFLLHRYNSARGSRASSGWQPGQITAHSGEREQLLGQQPTNDLEANHRDAAEGPWASSNG